MDRRDDLGGKILVGVLIVVIASLLMGTFNATRGEAMLARSEAQAATLMGTKHAVCLEGIEKRLEGMDKKIDKLLDKAG
jgi:hypothetical protein